MPCSGSRSFAPTATEQGQGHGDRKRRHLRDPVRSPRRPLSKDEGTEIGRDVTFGSRFDPGRLPGRPLSKDKGTEIGRAGRVRIVASIQFVCPTATEQGQGTEIGRDVVFRSWLRSRSFAPTATEQGRGHGDRKSRYTRSRVRQRNAQDDDSHDRENTSCPPPPERVGLAHAASALRSCRARRR